MAMWWTARMRRALAPAGRPVLFHPMKVRLVAPPPVLGGERQGNKGDTGNDRPSAGWAYSAIRSRPR